MFLLYAVFSSGWTEVNLKILSDTCCKVKWHITRIASYFCRYTSYFIAEVLACISHGGVISWPPRSLDLSSLDFGEWFY